MVAWHYFGIKISGLDKMYNETRLIYINKFKLTNGENVKVNVLNYEPNGINACCRLNNDEYTIYINIRLSKKQFYESFQHEIGHIIYNDFNSNLNLNMIEVLTHKRDKLADWKYEAYVENSSDKLINRVYDEGIKLSEKGLG